MMAYALAHDQDPSRVDSEGTTLLSCYEHALDLVLPAQKAAVQRSIHALREAQRRLFMAS
jgi:hypothetical protein